MRVFFGHPKAWEAGQSAEFASSVQQAMADELKVPVTVVTGKQDYEQNAARCGNFNGWCRDVVKRTDYQTGKRVYDLILLPRIPGLGKATGQIVQLALAEGIPVIEAEWLEGGGFKARPVSHVREYDPEDYISGWRVITTDT